MRALLGTSSPPAPAVAMGATSARKQSQLLLLLQFAVRWVALPTTYTATRPPLLAAAILCAKEAVAHALLSTPSCGRSMLTRFVIVMKSIVIGLLDIVKEDFVDTPIAYAKITGYVNYMMVGGATLGAEPTPRKRGPLPILSWRRGRLPSSTAWVRRPPALLRCYQFHCRNFLDTLRMRLEQTLK